MCKPQVSLRPARTDDCRLLWEWANDPAVRAVSFNTDPIPWGQHQQWFAAKLTDRACVFWVAEDNAGTPIGQVRYDVRQREATMSISMEKNCRGKGQGTSIIQEASRRLFAEQAVDVIHAFIREGNVASQRAFTRAGFCKAEETVVRGHAASRFEKRREQ